MSRISQRTSKRKTEFAYCRDLEGHKPVFFYMSR
jgi:hypothetical protein